jgi:hypothetical protein
MKRLFLAASLMVLMAAFLSSCTSSRKSRMGCPGTEGIIH